MVIHIISFLSGLVGQRNQLDHGKFSSETVPSQEWATLEHKSTVLAGCMDTINLEEATGSRTEPRARGVPMQNVALFPDVVISQPDIRLREAEREVMMRCTIFFPSKPPNIPTAAQLKSEMAFMKWQ